MQSTKIFIASLRSSDIFWSFTYVHLRSFCFSRCRLLTLHSMQQVCDNVGDHLIGNVYARYEWETEAQAAVDSCNERWYAGT